MTITAGSTFSGIGGLELAALQAGIPTLWSSEINADARSVLCRHFPESKLHGDIAEIGSHNADAVDLLCGGFPCQDLSVAGKRAGLAGERSGLFFEFARLLDEFRPTWFILENVPGLLSSDRGRDMGTLVGTLGNLGYGIAWRVLDAQNFGVPQRRRRVVIVGHLGDATRAGSVLFEPEGSERDPAASRQTGSIVAALTANGVGTCGADDNQGQAGHLIPAVSHALCATRGQRNDPTAATFLPVGFNTAKSSPIAHEQRSPTLTVNHRNVGVAIHPAAVRRLTPVECERLQGFPDYWTDVPNAKGKPMSDSARYRMLGNAVAVPVFRWLFERIAAEAAK